MPRSKKFSNDCDWKTNSHLLGVFHICLPGDSKVHFRFAVYEVSELQHTIWTRYCAARLSADQGAQNLRDACSLQSFPCHANPTVHLHTLVAVELKFSSFSPANFTDHLFAYYVALEKNKEALERKNECIGFTWEVPNEFKPMPVKCLQDVDINSTWLFFV